jgi:predicted deacylase
MASDESAPTVAPGFALARLWKNQGRYQGQTIDIQAVLQQIEDAARRHGWEHDCFFRSADLCIVAYRLGVPTPRRRLYISAGIHGDEPAGPLAVLNLLEAHVWPAGVEVWLCPCLNPTGFALNARENRNGIDLNRQYLKPEAEEIRGHVAWLEQQPRFDTSLCLHEDWEAHGFYVYELSSNPNVSYAADIVDRVAAVCPIDRSPTIEGREAHEGIIRPTVDLNSRPQWPEAFYLISHKTTISCTLEAPSDFPLSARVAALVAGVKAVLDRLAADDHP